MTWFSLGLVAIGVRAGIVLVLVLVLMEIEYSSTLHAGEDREDDRLIESLLSWFVFLCKNHKCTSEQEDVSQKFECEAPNSNLA